MSSRIFTSIFRQTLPSGASITREAQKAFKKFDYSGATSALTEDLFQSFKAQGIQAKYGWHGKTQTPYLSFTDLSGKKPEKLGRIYLTQGNKGSEAETQTRLAIQEKLDAKVASKIYREDRAKPGKAGKPAKPLAPKEFQQQLQRDTESHNSQHQRLTDYNQTTDQGSALGKALSISATEAKIDRTKRNQFLFNYNNGLSETEAYEIALENSRKSSQPLLRHSSSRVSTSRPKEQPGPLQLRRTLSKQEVKPPVLPPKTPTQSTLPLESDLNATHLRQSPATSNISPAVALAERQSGSLAPGGYSSRTRTNSASTASSSPFGGSLRGNTGEWTPTPTERRSIFDGTDTPIDYDTNPSSPTTTLSRVPSSLGLDLDDLDLPPLTRRTTLSSEASRRSGLTQVGNKKSQELPEVELSEDEDIDWENGDVLDNPEILESLRARLERLRS